MPYLWTHSAESRTLTLWPHQSLTARGFAWFIGVTVLLLAMPLMAVLGSPVAWVLLGFFIAAVWGVWRAIMVNRRRRLLHEELRLTPDLVRLAHVPHGGSPKQWEANPHWVRVNLRRDGPVENYLTLTGAGREVELGAFLTPEEREGLYGELCRLLRR